MPDRGLDDGKVCGNPWKIKDFVKGSPAQLEVGFPGNEVLFGVCERASPHCHHPTVEDWPPWPVGGENRLIDHQCAAQFLVDFAHEAAAGFFAFLKFSAGELKEAS